MTDTTLPDAGHYSNGPFGQSVLPWYSADQMRAYAEACVIAAPKVCKPLGMAVVDFIANGGCRNAAGGIYATRVQEFAIEVQRAFAQQNGLILEGEAP